MTEYRSRAIVRVDHLLACAMFQGIEETRYYLQGTNIAPHASGQGAVLTATDGRTLLAIYDAEAHAEGLAATWAVEAKTLKPLIAKWLKGDGKWNKQTKWPYWCVLVHNDAGEVSLSVVCAPSAQDVLDFGKPAPAGSLSETDDEPEATARPPFILVHRIQDGGLLVDGTFPDWRRVCPAFPKNGVIAAQPMQARYLKRISEMAMLLGSSQGFNSPGIAIHATSVGGPVRVVLESRPEVVCVVMPMRADCPAEDPGWLDWSPGKQKAEALAKAA